MPKIVDEKPFDGAIAKVERLGLQPLVAEVRGILTGFQLLVDETKHANSGEALRVLIDAEFERAGGWVQKVASAEMRKACFNIMAASKVSVDERQQPWDCNFSVSNMILL